MENRTARPRRGFFLVVTLTLLVSGPWVGWWWLIPLGVSALAFTVRRQPHAQERAPRPLVGRGLGLSVVMIGVSVALTGGPDSPGVGWFALPAVTVTARFERRGSFIAVVYMLAGPLASTLLMDPRAVMDDPSQVLFAIGMTIAAVILSAAVADSDREHRQEAVLDPLTGLPNRTALAQCFAELEREARRDEGAPPIGFIVGDLDHFKGINDMHGHDVGDEGCARWPTPSTSAPTAPSTTPRTEAATGCARPRRTARGRCSRRARPRFPPKKPSQLPNPGLRRALYRVI